MARKRKGKHLLNRGAMATRFFSAALFAAPACACFRRHFLRFIVTGGDLPTNSATEASFFRLFSVIRSKIEIAPVEVNSIGDVLLVPKAPRRVLDPLNLGVDRLAGSVGHPMAQIRDDVLEATASASFPPPSWVSAGCAPANCAT